ncbi:uncharacterized protein LOC112086116 [Eutrema salsugineum]|uniref:uncharacterized protein LOC112086116 n=1 Tax=Eutrema salsugineum TaxID=72664 RepID=UPI000CED67AC|nr:uncharacterized protein LOC112086116 [Eutrema salsugineum]
MLDKAAVDRRFDYHQNCSKLHLTHLCFADDLLVFCDGKARSIKGIVTVFDQFAAYSGLRISLEKSSIYMAGVSEDNRQSIIDRFPFAVGELPVRYLGLPLLTKRMAKEDYAPLIAGIRTRIGSWTAHHLSYAGRLQLLLSVISGLTNFWISAFKLPKSCMAEVESLCSAFLWAGPTLSTKKAKVQWKDVCKPKAEGWLGLRSLVEANKRKSFLVVNTVTSDWIIDLEASSKN